MTISKLLHALTLLPVALKKAHEKSISEKLPTLRREESIDNFFFSLNPLFSFIDYSLLEYIIKKFGSENLKKNMNSYSYDIQTFMKQTTVGQLMDLWPGEQDVPPDFSILMAKVNEDPYSYSLEKLDILRKKYCAQAKLSDIVCVIIGVGKSSSFLAMLLIPSVLVPDLIESTRQIKDNFFQGESIASLSVDSRWLYNEKLSPFGAELKERYQQSLKIKSPIKWIPSPTQKIFKLALIQKKQVQIEDSIVQMTTSGKIDDILQVNCPVEVEDFFNTQSTDGEIILIEGAPGSGKSTLTVHICWRWGKEELLEQFIAVILVQ